MDRHRLKQLRDKLDELTRFGSPSCMREARDIMQDEFGRILSFAINLTEPQPKPKRTITDNYPADGLRATEPCMFCEDYEKLEEENERLKEIESRAIDIQQQANLAADHKTYDLMRTVLGD